jgi:hypothetical protein
MRSERHNHAHERQTKRATAMLQYMKVLNHSARRYSTCSLSRHHAATTR